MEYYNKFSCDYENILKRDVVCPVTKIQVLDHNEFPMYEIQDDIVRDSDNISFSYAQGTQGKISFEITDTDGKYIPNSNSPFWYNKKFKFWKGVKDLYNGDIYWFSQGVYVITNVSAERNKLSVSGCDKFGMFSSEYGMGQLSANFKLEAGMKLKDAIEYILMTEMGNGKVIDPIKPIIDPRLWELTMGEDIDVNGGGYIADIIAEFANVSRAHVYYNKDGHLRVDKGTTDYLYQHQGQSWEFDDHKTAEYLSASVDYDFSSVINIIDVYGEDSEGRQYFYTAKNTNPKSETSINRIGRRYGGTIESLMGYNEENTKFFAESYLTMHTIQHLGVKVETILLPHLKVGDVVVVTDKYYGWDKKRFMINEISISGGKETLSLMNVDSLPYFEEYSD